MKTFPITITQKVTTTYNVELTDEQIKKLKYLMETIDTEDEEDLLNEVYLNLIGQVTGKDTYEYDSDTEWEGEDMGDGYGYESGNEEMVELIQEYLKEKEKREE